MELDSISQRESSRNSFYSNEEETEETYDFTFHEETNNTPATTLPTPTEHLSILVIGKQTFTSYNTFLDEFEKALELCGRLVVDEYGGKRYNITVDELPYEISFYGASVRTGRLHRDIDVALIFCNFEYREDERSFFSEFSIC